MHLEDNNSNARRSGGNTLLFASFGLSFCLILVVYAVLGIAPFGDKTLIFADAEIQLTYFLAYLRDLILGGQDAFYAFEKTIGGNIIGLLAYYLASPLNLIFALFSLENLPIALHLVVLLKLSLSSLTLAYYFKHTSGLTPASLMLTSAWALCGYTVNFLWAVMWLDAVVLLPLVALGLYRISRGGRPWLYAVSLSMAIITCYYTGYMLCAFSVLYFGYLLLTEHKEAAASVKTRLIRFSIGSLCAGGMSAFALLPTLLSQVDGKRQPFSLFFSYYTYSKSLMVLEMICPERAAEHDSLVKYVLFAALIFALVIIAALFLLVRSKRIAERIKVLVFAALGILILAYGSIFEPQDSFLYKLFVGFINYDEMYVGAPNIYSGLLTLVLAVYYFFNPRIDNRRKYGAALFLAVLFISMRFYVPNLIWHGFTENNCFNFRYSFIFSFFVLCLAKEGLACLETKRGCVIAAIAMLGMIIATGFLGERFVRFSEEINVYFVLWGLAIFVAVAALVTVVLSKNKTGTMIAIAAVHFFTIVAVPFVSWNRFHEQDCAQFFSEYKEEVSQTQIIAEHIDEPGDYLYRASIGMTTNAPMMFGFNGVGHFSSNEEQFVVSFLAKLGAMHTRSVWADGSRGGTDAFNSFFGVKYYLDEGVLKTNPTALPIAFLADSGLTECALDGDAFVNLNRMLEAVCPLDESVFKIIETEKNITGLKQLENDYYELADSSKGRIFHSFEMPADATVYYYNNGQNGNVYVNGKLPSEAARGLIVKLGDFKAGETVEVCLEFDGSGEMPLADIKLYYEDNEALNRYYEFITEQVCVSSSATDSSISTRVNSLHDGQYLLYTIPYDMSWKILVDGEETEAVKVFDALLAISMDSGEHIVELAYQPRGLVPGIIISSVTLLFMCATVLYYRKQKRSD